VAETAILQTFKDFKIKNITTQHIHIQHTKMTGQKF
jgi:hypothetical protein